MPDLIKVAKFGGTSMADAAAMRRCAAIVHSDPDKKILVVSATAGTTNLLTEFASDVSSIRRVEIAKQIADKHYAICEDLRDAEGAKAEIEKILQELNVIAGRNQIMSAMLRDEILAMGERLSSVIFARILTEEIQSPVRWLDARTLIKTDSQYGNAEPDIPEIEEAAKKHLIPKLNEQVVITQGFIGSDKNGITTTIGRGGSDYSAALIAEAIDADVLEVWTDVTAIYTTDPKIVPEAKPITEISFDEAAELSVFGAKILHPATMVPAMRKNIRVYVGSSIDPEKPGTWIVRDTKEHPLTRAISLRRNQTLLTVHSLDMLHRYGFLARLFEVLSRHKISVDLVTTSEVSVALTLDYNINTPGKSRLTEEVLNELKEFCSVDIQEDLSLIALVGNNLDATAGLSGPLFSLLEDVNIRLICHGASSHNLCFLIDSHQDEDVIRTLHKKFIS